MTNNFEKYLESQRHKLDVDEPDDALIWDGIEKDLHKPTVRWQNIFWKAAAILIFMASSIYVIYNEMYRSKTNIYKVSLSDIDPAYSQQVIQYHSIIDEKWQEVNELKPEDMESFETFVAELDELDLMRREYQEDFYKLGCKEQVIRSMLDYYDKRVRILDRMLMEIQKHNDYEKRHETHTEI